MKRLIIAIIIFIIMISLVFAIREIPKGYKHIDKIKDILLQKNATNEEKTKFKDAVIDKFNKTIKTENAILNSYGEESGITYANFTDDGGNHITLITSSSNFKEFLK